MKHTINSHLDSEDYESLKRCEICFPATAPLHNRIDELTAHNAAMQDDAVNNTVTIKMLMAQLAEQVEENRGLRQMLHMEPR